MLFVAAEVPIEGQKTSTQQHTMLDILVEKTESVSRFFLPALTSVPVHFAVDGKCDGNVYIPLSGDSGSFQSTNYPGKPEADETCKWNITVPSGKIVKLSFADFDLGNQDPKNCPDANVALVGTTPNDRNGRIKLCGSTIPPPVFSLTEVLTMQFVTGQAGSLPPGFNATYEAIPGNSGKLPTI